MNTNEVAVIIGAGPAGLTAAYELLNQKAGYDVIVLEATDRVGGISCTINHNGNRIDIGGHRFFSKNDMIMDWWMSRMPIQGSPASDDETLGKIKDWAAVGPDPKQTDRVMLIRDRISRIYYLRRFFDYPVSLKIETIQNLGFIKTMIAALGYLKIQLIKEKNETTLEGFLINRFGKPLYKMFFESYTEKVWGIHPRGISPEWGSQRIKGLSLSKAVYSALKKIIFPTKKTNIRQKKQETSLIEKFLYPKLGPGQLWEYVSADIINMGGKILLDTKVIGINVENRIITSVRISSKDGERDIECCQCLSSMPIKDLYTSMTGDVCDKAIYQIATNLPYRDFMTVGLLVNKLKIKNQTKIKTLNDIIPDTWIYIQEPDVKLCRLQIFNNWSPYMVKDPNKIWIGLEYMCHETDDIWRMCDEEFIEFAVNELVQIDIIEKKDVSDSCRIRIEKAYPAYFGTYSKFDDIKNHLNQIQNLYCLGRNGQHRYNNQDHSMLTAIEAVRLIVSDDKNKDSLWDINTEKDYHEEKNKK